MTKKPNRMREVEEVPYGVYLWMTPDGKYIADDEDHYYMISAMKGDKVRIQALKDGVRHNFGITEGEAVYFSGHRIVSDEEYEEQRQRLLFGLVPDKFDIPAIEEDKRRNAGNRR